MSPTHSPPPAVPGAGVYRCVHCHSSDLQPAAGELSCRSCRRRYPVHGGVPLLAKDFAVEPSGYHLSDALADKLCQQLGIPANPDNLGRLIDILSRRYRIGGFQQTAENNYFLNRVVVDEGAKRPPLRARFADHPVNTDIAYTVDLHYVPPVLTAGEVTSYNVRLTNTGRSVISSRTTPRVGLCCLWHQQGRGRRRGGRRDCRSTYRPAGRCRCRCRSRRRRCRGVTSWSCCCGASTGPGGTPAGCGYR